MVAEEGVWSALPARKVGYTMRVQEKEFFACELRGPISSMVPQAHHEVKHGIYK